MRRLSFLLAVLIALPFPGLMPAQEAPHQLNLVIVEGEGAINNIRQRTAREPIVQVEDENHKPVAGAVVVFALPSQGAGGTFTGGAQTLTVITDNQGRAVAAGLRPNGVEGQFQIHVTASHRGSTANTTIGMTNAAAAGAGAAAGASAGISTKLIVIIAAVAAAAAGGAIIATRSGGGGASAAPAPTPITISPGTGTVGPPR